MKIAFCTISIGCEKRRSWKMPTRSPLFRRPRVYPVNSSKMEIDDREDAAGMTPGIGSGLLCLHYRRLPFQDIG